MIPFYNIDTVLSIIVNILAPTVVAGLGLGAYNASQIGAKTPGNTPSGDSLEQLAAALDTRIDEISPGRQKPVIGLTQNVPGEKDNLLSIMRDTSKYADNGRRVDGDGFDISINPNADRSYFAHELGHVASAQTDVGHLVRSARGNKALTRALGGAALLAAGGSALATDGDDDLATSVALAYAGAAPEILDEVLATKNGLAIMDTANMRASLGQRGKLASGLLSYLGAPLLVGAGANLIGNQFDDPSQTESTMMPQ